MPCTAFFVASGDDDDDDDDDSYMFDLESTLPVCVWSCIVF